MKYGEIVSKLTLREKAALCSGKDFWHLNGVEMLSLPEIMVSDGPHGLRKHPDKKDKSDLMNSVPAVCFPSAATSACSWDEDLLCKMGQALGDECLAEKVSVLLGPGINMKRSPLCGRNFEYFSEDPFLAGKMASAWIRGVQSKGIGASLKHFATNSQETRRMVIDSVVDERTLREIYLAGFETAVKEAKPYTVMNAYNKLNGTYCAENKKLLNDILREEWGFDGVVETDWGAENNIVDGIKAGQNLEMPGSNGLGAKKIVDAVMNGELSEEVLDESVDKIVGLIMKAKEVLGDYSYDKDEHHKIAAEIAAGSMTLLKNDDSILPLSKSQKVALIGEMAKSPRYQGAGSSQINAKNIESAFDAMSLKGCNFIYSRGYNKKKDAVSLELLEDAVFCAKNADVAVVFIGLTEEFESEGFDRIHLSVPQCHIELLKAVHRVNPNTVVVLAGGSPVEMPWLSDAKALLNSYLGGESSGRAVADILYGDVCPSGKLAETYPVCLADTPSVANFPGGRQSVEFREGLYIGYRYYDTAGKDVLFPFGFGLSYTAFEYSDLKFSKKSVKDTGTVDVSVTVKNTGSVAGAEIVQFYVHDVKSSVYRPEKELKGFKKVFLEPGESKTVTVTLDKRSFAYYNTLLGDWHVESGDFTVMAAASSRDIRLEAKIRVNSSVPDAPVPEYPECYRTADIMNVSDEDFEKLLGREIPYANEIADHEITLNSALEDADFTPAGKFINNLLVNAFRAVSKGNASQERMMTSMALQIPIRCFISMSMGVFTPEMADGLCLILNGKGTMKGIGKIVGGIGAAIGNIGLLFNSI